MSMKTKGALALLGGVLMLSLAACSPAAETGAGDGAVTGGTTGSSAASQTKEEACEIVGTEVAAYAQTVTEKYESLELEEMTSELLTADQKASLVEMDRILGLVSNDEVKTSFFEVIEASKAAIPLMEKVIADPASAAEIMASQEYTDLQTRNTEATAAFETVCPGALVSATPPSQ